MNINSGGTNNLDVLINADKNHFLHPATNPKQHAEDGPKTIFSDGDGIYVTNAIDGEQYIDGMSMLWNVNLGHGQKRLVDAAKKQLSAIACTSNFRGFSNTPAIQLAKKLSTLTPGDLNTVFFTSGGSESNDTTFKLSRFYWGLKGKPGKKKFISLTDAYHGVTMASQTATAIPAFHKFAGSFIEGMFHAKSHLTDCELGNKEHPDYARSIRGIIEREGADTVAGVIMEPVQGAGGVNIPPKGYLKAVRKLCDEYNIHFIADEVICGFGRTGKMFGVENWDVVPDIMTTAKGINSGYTQLGAVIVNDEIREEIVNFDGMLSHGFTYSGHPTACAIGLEAIQMIEDENIVQNVQEMGAELRKGLDYLEDKHAMVTNTRSIGLLSALDIYKDPNTKELFDHELLPADTLAEECFKRNLILRSLGASNQSLAIAPPLIINKKGIEEIISRLDDALTATKEQLS